MAGCNDGYMHKYKEVWRREHNVPAENIDIGDNHWIDTAVTICWYIQRCRRCGIYRGARPDHKFYGLVKENAQSAIIDNYEQWILDETADALADI